MHLESIENILDEFDFNRVQETMEALDWQWWDVEGIPSISDLRRRARSLLEDVYNKSDEHLVTTSTGGFEASRVMMVGDLNKYLSLKFVVAEFDNFE
jgi:hypothetical protein